MSGDISGLDLPRSLQTDNAGFRKMKDLKHRTPGIVLLHSFQYPVEDLSLIPMVNLVP